MREAWRRADRDAELREAARGWREAGLLGEQAAAALEARLEHAGPALGWTWRALVCACTLVGSATAVVLLFITLEVRGEGAAALLMFGTGVGLALVTEALLARSGYRWNGAEAATSLIAVALLTAALPALLDEVHLRGPQAARAGFAWAALVLALAAWRWGVRLYAGAAAAAAIALAAWLPAPRVSWIAAAALVAAGAAAALRGRDLAPAHRGGLELARAVALAAVYFAVNYYSVDKGALEELGRAIGARHHRPGDASLVLAGLGSCLYPAALLAWGLRARDRALICLGAVAAALSLATLRFYVHVAPLWAVLAAGGAALAGAALLLERWLRAGQGGERGGFTADRLYAGERREQLLSVAAAFAAAPAARQLPGEGRGVEGGDGRFGGGGASGAF